jgi:ABC-type transport system involved in multi-copper enzyme maturation permease subunit
MLSGFLFQATLILILMAVVVAHWTYAQPRLSGTLEPVLVRPVTRQGILLDRYLGATVMLAIAATISISIFDVAAGITLGQPMPLGYLAPLILGPLAAAVAFIGIMFLLAHSLRTSGAVVTVGLILVVALAFFWGSLATLDVFAFGGSPSPYTQLVSQLRIEMISPASIPNLVPGLLTGSGTAGGQGSPYALAGVSVVSVVTDLAIWILVPLIVSFLLAKARD